jgi:hypothetical protein
MSLIHFAGLSPKRVARVVLMMIAILGLVILVPSVPVWILQCQV